MGQSKDMMKLMQNLEIWRVQNHLTQTEMAKRIDVSKATYSKLLSGEVSTISADTIRDIYFTTGSLCFQLMEIYDDDYLKLIDVLRKFDERELKYMLEFVEVYIEARSNIHADRMS